MTDIKLGSKVITPVTDNDNEVSYQVGKLIDINKRYATVDIDGIGILKVGKTKIELFAEPKAKAEPKNPDLKGSPKTINKKGYDYDPCRSHRNKPSCDNGDIVAQKLRGKSLDEVYLIASNMLGLVEGDLRLKYAHLNPGQQRMCLGNRLRVLSKS